MGARTTKLASDGSQTVCPACGKAVRGQKGLKAHRAICPVEPRSDKGECHGSEDHP